MAAVNNHTKPWFQYFCTANTDCQAGFSCHFKYCIPELKENETCVDEKDTVAPFLARVNNKYHLYCDLPNDMTPQATCPSGCEAWEDCHASNCFMKKCNSAETACKKGDINACQGLGIASSDVICFDMAPHGNTHPKGDVAPQSTESGLSSAQIGGIAGGVSAAVVVLAAVGAFFLVKKRRAAKAARNQTNSDLPVYSAPNYPVETTEKQSA
ncbi:hypothetical protein DFQ27_001768 [Actinomortierella ambigua]|uniref:Uncharacterized protein n=1 Tax=Actinomortierella ambigua TaxID=1343610 RepID=A0A9P6U895_9FUNG|nr:hypothetical protein DFQ27_001768 [Actinomortierella ambigua]